MKNRFIQIFNQAKGKTSQGFKQYKKLYSKPWYIKLITGIVTFIILFFIYLVMVDVNFLNLFGKSPSMAQIKAPTSSEASEVYSADGVLIGKFFNQNRTPVTYKEVSPNFWKALIDTEDERFYKHYGIDIQGVFGAIKDAVTGRDARGASTITQQLAKNMFRVRTQYSTGLLGKIPGIKMLVMKSKEWIIAMKLEWIYDKNQILTMYANTVDFGSNSFGVKTAAKTYFNTTPDKLTKEQAAVLVGMLKATTYYNPISNPENCLKRRNVVMANMLKHQDITQAEYDNLIKIPIKLQYNVEKNYDGQAKYFKEALAEYLKDWCLKNGYDLYSSGLKIYTTIDTRMQKYAEEAATKQMKQVQSRFNSHWGNNDPWVDENKQVIPNFIENIAKRLPLYKYLLKRYKNNLDSVNKQLNKPHEVKLFDYEKGQITKNISTLDSIRYMVKYMHCSFIAIEPQSRHVKAWVGDIDFDTWKYDKVTAMRQPGSTFKLFVYSEAMNQGLTPCDKRRDEYFSMKVFDKKKQEEVIWTPHNADGRYTGDSIPLKSAFARSINTVAVRLGQELGIQRIIETANHMGINSPLDDTPALALGSSDVQLIELVNAYGTVCDNGIHKKPVLVTVIRDREGNDIYISPSTQEQAIPYKSAFYMQQLLLGGLREPGGTSQSLWSYVGDFKNAEFGGKTGTSNNHSDAWFVGVSPKLVVGAWVGGEYRSIHFRTGALGQGSKTALPICGYFLNALLKDPQFKKYIAKFDKPKDKDIIFSSYNCNSYYPRQQYDSTSNDSTKTDEEFNEDMDNKNEQNHKIKEVKEEEITLDDL